MACRFFGLNTEGIAYMKPYPRPVRLKRETIWSERREPLSSMAEAAVAAVLEADDPETWWHGGHNQAFDVTGNGVKVDAKVAFVEEGRTRGSKQTCLAYMGSRREHTGGSEVREGVDYYALAVPGENASVTVDLDLRVAVAPIQFSVYLVPADQVPVFFLRGERKRDGAIGDGMVRYCPLDMARRFLVAGPNPRGDKVPTLTGANPGTGATPAT